MLKTCWFDASGQLINIGEWDTMPEQVEVSPAQCDEDGNLISPAVYETVERNPIPPGAYSEDREVVQEADGGWRVVDLPRKVTLEERIKATEDMLLEFLIGGI